MRLKFYKVLLQILNNMLIDTHCHIQFNAYKTDSEEVIKRCTDKDMILNAVGSQIDTSRRAVEYAEKYPNIYATIGLHPVHLFPTTVDEGEVVFKTREESFDFEEYKKLASHPKVIAIGECGLELYHLPENVTREEVLAKQKHDFLLQYKLATELGLPMVIHIRDAHPEMIELLKTLPHPIKGVVHCYTGNWEYAEEYLKMGLYLGFTGVITFPPKKTNPAPQLWLTEVVEKIPLDRILVETDSPYLAPTAYRGKRAEPWMVEEVVKKIAEIRKMGVEEIEKISFNNALELFNKIII